MEQDKKGVKEDKYKVIDWGQGLQTHPDLRGLSDAEALLKELRLHSFVLLQFPPQSLQKKQRSRDDGLSNGELRAQQFFKETPQSYKDSLITKAIGDTGYMNRKSVKEQYQIRLGPQMPWSSATHEESTPEIEKQMKNLRKASQQLYSKLNKISRECLVAIGGPQRAVELLSILDPADPSDNYPGTSVLTYTNYYNGPEGPQEACKSHSDTGLLTLCLHVSPGLEIYDPCGGQWVDVGSLSMKFDAVLLCGEALSRRCPFPTTAHRVSKTATSRFSTVFKLRPRPDIMGPRTEADYALCLLQNDWVEQTKHAQLAHFQKVADETLVHIFSYLKTPFELGTVSMVCRSWNRVSQEDQLWRNACQYFMKDIKGDEQAPPAQSGCKTWRELCAKNYTFEREWRKQAVSESGLRINEFQENLQAVFAKRPPVFQFGAMAITKLTVVGKQGVGKTCLLLVLSGSGFPEEYIPTVFDEWVGNMQACGVLTQFGLWDTAGGEDYARLRPLAYPGTSLFILTYAINDKQSFEELASVYKPEIRVHAATEPIIVIATKSDLRGTGAECISYEAGVGLANSIGAVAFLEVSAKDNTGMQSGETFTMMELCSFLVSIGLAHEQGVLPSLAKVHKASSGKRGKKDKERCKLQ